MSLLPQAERLRKTIAGEIPDRVPNFEFFFGSPRIFEHYVGKPSGGGWPGGLELALRIGWGACYIGALGFGLGGRSEVASDGTSHYAGGKELTWDTLEKMQEPEIDKFVEDVATKKQQVGAEGLLSYIWLLHCFHSAATGIGLERFALLCYDDFDLVHAYMHKVEGFNQKVLRTLIDADALPDMVFFDADCAFKNALMVRPQMYRDLVFDATKQTVDIVRQQSRPYCFHSDGKMDDLYPILIELGVWGAHGVEAQANDLAEVKARFGDQLTLFGNMDPVLLAWASPEEIEVATKIMIQTGAPGGRYGAAVNTIVSDYTPLENYLAFQQTIERVGWYNTDGTLAT